MGSHTQPRSTTPDLGDLRLPTRVLITGGAGFIGSHIADALLTRGVDVWVLDDLSTGLRENVPPAARLMEGNICDEGCVRDVMAQAKPEAVFHLAAQMDVRRSLREPVFDATTNVLGSLKLLLACVEGGVRRIVYSSSGGAAYGDVATPAVPETQVPRPISEYGASKVAVEHYLSVYHARGAIETVALRYPNVFGPRQRPAGEAGVVAIFAGSVLRGQRCRIFGDGSKTRDYVYITDIVRGTLLALRAARGTLYNLGTGCGTSDQQVYDAVSAALGFEEEPDYLPFRPGEVMHIALDSRAADKDLGWRPEVSFDDGVR